jgi:hypothetical protein
MLIRACLGSYYRQHTDVGICIQSIDHRILSNFYIRDMIKLPPEVLVIVVAHDFAAQIFLQLLNSINQLVLGHVLFYQGRSQAKHSGHVGFVFLVVVLHNLLMLLY